MGERGALSYPVLSREPPRFRICWVARTPLNPPLKLVLPKTPGATNLKGRNLSLSGETCDSKGMEVQALGHFVGGERLEQFHARGPPG